MIDVWPRNELNLVPGMLYEHSNLSLSDIQKDVALWQYDKKVQALQMYIGKPNTAHQMPGQALETAHYSFDIMYDYGTFRDLQHTHTVDNLSWQQLTPRYGYEIPGLIEEAGLTDEFEACFDASLALHSRIQAAGFMVEAQYATLHGHRIRWTMTYSARQAYSLHALRINPQTPLCLLKLLTHMQEKIAEVHPLLADTVVTS